MFGDKTFTCQTFPFRDAMKKPVVLVSSNEADVPFDLHHIRVIYYDLTDPLLGNEAKLIESGREPFRIEEPRGGHFQNPDKAME